MKFGTYSDPDSKTEMTRGSSSWTLEWLAVNTQAEKSASHGKVNINFPFNLLLHKATEELANLSRLLKKFSESDAPWLLKLICMRAKRWIITTFEQTFKGPKQHGPHTYLVIDKYQNKTSQTHKKHIIPTSDTTADTTILKRGGWPTKL